GDPVADCFDEARMGMARAEGAESHREIEIFIPVDVPDASARGPPHVQRVRVDRPVVAVHTVRGVTPGFLKEAGGTGRPLSELRDLSLEGLRGYTLGPRDAAVADNASFKVYSGRRRCGLR